MIYRWMNDWDNWIIVGLQWHHWDICIIGEYFVSVNRINGIIQSDLHSFSSLQMFIISRLIIYNIKCLKNAIFSRRLIWTGIYQMLSEINIWKLYICGVFWHMFLLHYGIIIKRNMFWAVPEKTCYLVQEFRENILSVSAFNQI